MQTRKMYLISLQSSYTFCGLYETNTIGYSGGSAMVAGQGSTLIGAAVKRKEDPRLLTGAGKYTGDVPLRGMTYMAVLRSPHAHAHLRRIEAARARPQPGVLAAVTGHESAQHVRAPR